MKFSLRPIATVLASLLVGMSAMSLDLPVKTINGKEYYYYAVKRGDTLPEVARTLGVTREDIVKYNPSAGDMLRQGSTIYLPVDAFKDVISPSAQVAESPAGGVADQPFFYKVQRGETLFGVSHRFGLRPEQIIELNPAANDGINPGETLRIPAGARVIDPDLMIADTGRDEPAAETAATPVVAQQPVEEPEPEKVPPMPTDNEIPRELRPVEGPELVEAGETVDTVRPSVALMLPLMLQGDAQAKQARSATEFIKGFMMGLKSRAGQAWPMDLYIYDTAGRPDTIATILRGAGPTDLSLIITTDAQPVVDATLSAMGDRDTYLLNLMAVQDTAYLSDDRVLQFNVPHDIMYAKAGEALMSAFDGYTPVFLISKGGRSEKVPFTDYVRGLYAENGVETVDVAFEGMLTQRELEELDPTGRYVFIPGSGSLTEFNKFAPALLAYRRQAADPAQIGLFGYPDWTIFRNDALDQLHDLGAVIYSRFYNDATDPGVKSFEASFEKEYGAAAAELVPSQALLGYDTARYLLENIGAGKGEFNPEYDRPYQGLQSTFMFIDAESESPVDGTANQAVYIISFLPDNEVSVQVI